MRNVSGQFDHKRLQLLTVEGLQQRFQSWTLRNRVGLIQKNQACRDRVFAPASPDILAGTGRSDRAIGLKGTAHKRRNWPVRLHFCQEPGAIQDRSKDGTLLVTAATVLEGFSGGIA